MGNTVTTTHTIIVTGAGGVGKTTVSAGLAAAAVARGYRTLVLTVDPARRLADTLSSPGLSNDPVPVAGSDGLWAAMLDATESWEAMIERHTEPEVTRRLEGNPFFRAIADRFPAAQSYAAGEQLAEYLEAGAWEVVVVDTPPAGGGIDFFRAPHLMQELIGGRVLRWLTGAGLPGRRMLYRVTTRPMLRLVDTVLGGPLLEDLAEFLLDLRTLYDGLRDRARIIERYLAEATTVVVTTAQPTPLLEARRFHQELPETASAPSVVIFNRSLPPQWAEPASFAKGRSAVDRALHDNFTNWSRETQRRIRLRSDFAAETGLRVAALPWLDRAPTTVDAVADLIGRADDDLLDLVAVPER
jgi:arsenite-transporting ATPase